MLREIKEAYRNLVTDKLTEGYDGSVLVVLSKGDSVHEHVIGSVSDAQQVVSFALNAETGGYERAILQETAQAVDFASFDEYVTN